MKRGLFLFLALCLLLSGCAPIHEQKEKQYTATFLDLFDTVTSIVGFAESEEAFAEKTQAIHDDLERYHKLFDIYNDYEGVSNLKTVNDNAGVAPVTVDGAIIRLLQDCRMYYTLTGGKVNCAMGSVLSLWHDARAQGVKDPANAALPRTESLRVAAEHVDFDAVVIDEGASTVFLTDPLQRLDVGAVAKGWAVQRAAENAPAGMLLSVGGNVCATGPKPQKNAPWIIGIQSPDRSDENLHTIYLEKGAVVTSGDYQRTYTVAGKAYHHIIDPETTMPAEYWRAVTVVCEDSALADALSTALFLLPQEEGKTLASACGVEAFWVDKAGKEHWTDGFVQMIRT